MILLDSTRHSAASPVAVALLLGILGLLAIWGGMRIRNARIPNFVTTYTGRASGALTLPFTGICLLCAGVAGVGYSLPSWVKGLIGLVLLLTGAIALLGTFIWFPRFLLPAWYRRATRTGVPRNDRHLMGWFKELSEDDQEELVRLRTEHDAKDSPRDARWGQLPPGESGARPVDSRITSSGWVTISSASDRSRAWVIARSMVATANAS